MHWTDELKKIDKLPQGHIGRAAVERRVEKEYAACSLIERKWNKRFGKSFHRSLTLAEAVDICEKLCEAIGERKLQAIIINSPDVHAYAGAHYNSRRKEIHFPKSNIYFLVLIHELGHHYCHTGLPHGKDFCQTLEVLFYAVYILLLNKNPKKHWYI